MQFDITYNCSLCIFCSLHYHRNSFCLIIQIFQSPQTSNINFATIHATQTMILRMKFILYVHLHVLIPHILFMLPIIMHAFLFIILHPCILSFCLSFLRSRHLPIVRNARRNRSAVSSTQSSRSEYQYILQYLFAYHGPTASYACCVP